MAESGRAPVLCLSQLLDLLAGPRGPQHEAFVATWGESPAEDDRGGGGQLPRDSGQATHRACAPCLPGVVDAGESQSGAAEGVNFLT